MNRKIVILTGAGISAESGLKTFRDNNGLWEDHSVYEVATPEAFASNPKLVHRFYNARRAQLLSDEVKENFAHQELGRLEKENDGEVLVITQNVDNLHERGGTKNILHMHGELLKVKCKKTQKSFYWEESLSEDSVCGCCHEAGNLRPDIVWFGEDVYHMQAIADALRDCDIFMAIGTSGQVYPAAQFVTWVPASAQTFEVNKEQTQISALFQGGFYGNATEQVSLVVDKILKGEI